MIRNDIKTLGEYFNAEDPSIFGLGVGLDAQRSIYQMPWLDDEKFVMCLDGLDDLYETRSFDKPAGSLIRRYAGNGSLTQGALNRICIALIAQFFDKWGKEWATRTLQYNPIQNYKMTEQMTDDEKVTEYGRTNTRTDDLSEVTTPDLTTEEASKIYGFNSSSGVDDKKVTTDSSGTTTTDNTGTVTDAASGTDTETRNYTLTREGNIGVTTSQQMIESERELWKWDFFNDVVFPDIDSVFTLKIY